MDNNYQLIRIQRYLQGELSPQEMFQLERDALDDPFLEDAMEGYRLQDKVEHGRLSLLQSRLATRIEQQKVERTHFYFGGQRLGIAATACVLFVLGILLFWMRADLLQVDQESTRSNAVASSAPVEIAKAPRIPSSGEQIHLKVVALGGEKQPSSLAPVGGWQDFEIFLNEEVNWGGLGENEFLPFGSTIKARLFLSQTGMVELVQVDSLTAEGTVPYSIRTELVRLLQEGPKWKGKRKEVLVQIEFQER